MMQYQPRYRPGEKIGGRYLVHKGLLGGMGEVYLCLDLERNRPFALKTFQTRYIKDRWKDEQVFNQEIQIWISLEKHPNIVHCFSMDVLDGRPFMILEWVTGEEGRGNNLRDWLQGGAVDLKQALEFAIDICRGLEYATAKRHGIVHRDLKPENILVTHDRVAKITDWGLSTITMEVGLDGSMSQDASGKLRHTIVKGAVVGTPCYMAPEQWLGKEMDQRTDIYALGCILYEAISGYLAYPGTTLDQLRYQHLEGTVPELSTRRDLRSLDLVIRQCLAKNQAERFGSASELRARLAQVYRDAFAVSPKEPAANNELEAPDYINRGIAFLNLKRYDDAAADFERAIQIGPNMHHSYVNRGILYTILQQYDKALADLSFAIELSPATADSYVNRGNVYACLHQYDRAFEDLRRALELDPQSRFAWENLGELHRTLGQNELALSDYTHAIDLCPTDPNLHVKRGNTRSDLRHDEEAIADFDQAIDLDPIGTAALYLSRAIFLAGKGAFVRAIADLTTAIVLSPELDRLYTARGAVYVMAGRYQEALVDLDRSLAADQTNPLAYNSRADAHRGMGHYGDALLDYSRAIELNPNKGSYRNDRGIVHYELQRYDAAAADFLSAIELDRGGAEAHFNMGLVRQAEGQFADALHYFEFAYALGYDRGAEFAAKARKQLEGK